MSKQVKNAENVQSPMQQDADFFRAFTESEFDVSDNFRINVFENNSSEVIRRVDPVRALHFDVQACRTSNCHSCVKLPSQHIFQHIDGLGLILWLLGQQRYGSDGHLLTNGNNNFFYVQVSKSVTLLLSIAFDVKDSKWCLDAVEPDGFAQWFYYDRIFVPDDGVTRVPAGRCMCDADVNAKTAFIQEGADHNQELI